MNKLLQHMMDAGDVDHKFLPLLQKMQKGGETIKIKDSRGRVREFDTDSAKYRRLYNQGKIGRWSRFDETSGQWVQADPSDPNAEFISSPKILPEVLVSARPKPNTLSSYSTRFYKETPYEEFFRNRYNQLKDEFTSQPQWAQTSVGGWDRESRQRNVTDQINQEYQKKYTDYISQNLQKRNPQGNQMRDVWLSNKNFTDRELGFLTGSSNLPQPSLWAQGLQGVYNLADMAAFGQLPEENVPGIAKAEVSQYNNPLLALSPLVIPGKIVQSVYKDNYSLGDALAGRPNNASVAEDIFTDPFTYATFGAKSLFTAGSKLAPQFRRFGRYIPSFGRRTANLVEVVDPETGVSSFVSKPRTAAVSRNEAIYGRDDQGIFIERDGRRTYQLEPPTSEITLGQPSRTPLTNITQEDYERLLQTAREKRQQIMGASTDQMNDATDRTVDLWRTLRDLNYDVQGMSADAPLLRMQRALGTSINDQASYQDALSNIIRSYVEKPPAYNWPSYEGGLTNWNVSNNRSVFGKLASYLGDKAKKVDKDLGKLFSKSQEAPFYNNDELLRLINENLSKGMGIKKTNLPLEVRLPNSGGVELFPDNRSLELRTFVQGKPTGSISFQRNMIPFEDTKSLSQIIFGNRASNARKAWENTIGFRKTGDFPFSNYSSVNPVQDASGKVFSGPADFYSLGVSGEFNKAINEAFKSKGLGNILSGGTGHSDLGGKRWDKLVDKGQAHRFGSYGAQDYYMLKRKGGPIVDPRGQWAYPGERTIVPTPTGKITMKNVPYPVYGQDETGFAQMMYPGGEYTFPGQMVDEIPMMGKGGQHGGLDRWFAEKWVDVKTGKACGRQEGENRAYPACRPSRRVSSETPKTSSEMSPAEKAKFKRSKTSSKRINYNHKRMQEGGMLPQYQMRGQVMSTADSIRHQANKILQYEQLQGGPGGSPLAYYSDPKYMKMLMDTIYPQVKNILPNASAMEAGEAMDFIFNAGWDNDNKKILRDPRAYALQEYYKQYDRSKLDKDGKWPGRKNPAYSFDQEYNSTIGKLPQNQRRVMMNRGRDWYYKNINNPAPGVPNDDYYDTWYGRIWNTNDFLPFNPNNPNFKPNNPNFKPNKK